MITQTVNKAVKYYLSKRYRRIEQHYQNGIDLQKHQFSALIKALSRTHYGIQYGVRETISYREFQDQVPLVQYEDIRPYIDRMMHGEADVLWPGVINWFAKSSGTTGGASKFIPISKQNLYKCHIAAAWDIMSILYHFKPESQMFAEKTMVMGGSLQRFLPYPQTIVGDISAIWLHHMPKIGRPFYTPDFDTALLPDMEEKLDKMLHICTQENVVMFGGVPTWLSVFFHKVLDYTGKDNILEVWPNAKILVHGGVGFEPYRAQFQQLLPANDFGFLEAYNASEGYFGIQDHFDADGMMLLLDNDIFYEFIPLDDQYQLKDDEIVPLSEVDVYNTYAIVISSSSGLWRYMPGDTIKFSRIAPYRIKIVGRTTHFINAFGEEVMVANTDQAIANTCQCMTANVSDYTVAPIYFQGGKKGGHEWLIEFEKEPEDIELFCDTLDLQLQKINSDYEAKRQNDLALKRLTIKTLPKGTFRKWMAHKGQLSVQNKIPRLSNNREYVENILAYVAS